MGKIYAAMSKVEEGQDGTASNRANRNAKANGKPAQLNLGAGDKFDFLSYSLNLGPAREALLEPEEAARARQAISRAAREVELDFGRLDPHLVTLGDCDPAAADQYHRLAATLISAAIRRPIKRALIASALHGDGRTSVMLNLAGALAAARRRTLVVDTDLLRPSALRLLGVESEVGLAETLAGEARLEDAIIKLLPSGLHLLPTRGLVENSAEALASAEFSRLLDELDRAYDFILFDSAPLLAAGDATLLLHCVDTALLVVSPDRCTAAQAARVASMLASEDIFGVALNRVASG